MTGPLDPFLLVAGDTARNPGRSGIQTVVRSLAAAFGALGAPARPVIWKPGADHLRPLPPELSLGWGAEPLRDPPERRWPPLRSPGAVAAWILNGGRTERLPVHLHPRRRDLKAGSWVLLPELLYGGKAPRLVSYVHRHGWRLAAIFHDAIPLQAPRFVPPDLPASHGEYMRALSRADLILPNSEASAEGWREFMGREGLAGPPVRTITLACDIPGAPRVREARTRPPGAPIGILCVSTLEPRKNHGTLLAAFERAVALRPDLPLELDLVGAPYAGSHDIVESVHRTMNRLPGRVRWREKIEHSLLLRLYQEADFTVYPSVLEGFGLPVIESLWFGCPCVCASFGVMAENAAGGGCLTADVRDPEALAGAMLQVAGSAALRQKLASEATARPLKTWRDYAGEVLEALAPPRPADWARGVSGR